MKRFLSLFLHLKPQFSFRSMSILPVLLEDDHLLVISKPPGLVVHPAGGHQSGTLVHGLLHLCKELPAAAVGRPGIVHRLDKDTSGVMLVAKTELCPANLMADFKDRKIRKTYHALLLRCPRESDGRIVAPIGRHPVDRKKMAIRPVHGQICGHQLACSGAFFQRLVPG